jgi:hypothetical protein
MTNIERTRTIGRGLRALLCGIWKPLPGLNPNAARLW